LRTLRAHILDWRTYLLLTLPLAFAEKADYAGWFSHRSTNLVTAAFLVLSAVMIVAGTVRNGSARPVAWFLVASMQAMDAVAYVSYHFSAVVLGTYAFPGLPDYLWALSMLVLVVGLLPITSGRTARDWAGLIDATVVSAAAGLLMWVFMISPALAQAPGWVERLLLVYPPIADIVMFWMVARLVFRRGATWSPTLVLLASALVVLMTTHWAFAAVVFRSFPSEAQLRLFDLAFLVGDSLIAASALHPSVRDIGKSAPRERYTTTSTWRLVALGAASLLSPTVLAIGYAHGRVKDVPVIAFCSALMFVLVVVRMAGLLRVQAAVNRELKATVEQLNRVDVELRHAQKLQAVGKLAAGVAHELNTPIQFIGSNLRFLQDSLTTLLPATSATSLAPDEAEFLRAEVPRAITDSIDGVDRVGAIVAAMKRFGDPEDTHAEPADLNEIVTTALTVLTAELQDIERVTTDLGAVTQVSCFRADMNQVLLNLIVNAADAIRDSGRPGHLQVATGVERGHAFIRVEDTGTGIPEDIQDRVFEAFFTTKEVGRGTGQGLALVWNIVVERHGGTVELDSEVGRGTCFTVRLPLALVEEQRSVRTRAHR